MKRAICLILLLTVLLSLLGCSGADEDGVSFYYLRNSYSYGASDSVIASEQRDISARRDELNYLLGLYFAGPLEDTLRSPFPRETRLLEITLEEDVLSVQLSEEFAALEGMNLTLAGACIASTCFSLTDTSEILIYAGESATKPLLSFTRNSLTLLDSITTNMESETGD